MNSRRCRCALLVSVLAALSGCESLVYRGFSTRPIQDIGLDSVESVIAKVRERMVTPPADVASAPEAGATATTAAAFDRCARSEVSSDQCRALRNAALATLIGVSDHACNEHLKSIYGRESGWNVALGSLATLFSGTASVVGSTAAKSNYAAASTFFGAERSLANEVVYKNQLVPAIHYKIVEKRQERRTALFLRFPVADTDYPFRAAIADAIQYHYTCSFMEGLQWALREGTTDSEQIRLLRAREHLRSAQVDLASAQARTTAADDLAVREAAARVQALGRLIRQLETGEAPGGGSSP